MAISPFRLRKLRLRALAAAVQVAFMAPPPPPVDTDGDGIPDSEDLYPNDPTNTPPAPPPPSSYPADLNTAGKATPYWNPGVMASLFQDDAGTVPVTAAGQTVRRINDLSGLGRHLIAHEAGGVCTLAQDAGGRAYIAFNGTQGFMTDAFSWGNELESFLAIQRDNTDQLVLNYGAVGGDQYYGVTSTANTEPFSQAGLGITVYVDGTLVANDRSVLGTALGTTAKVIEYRGLDLTSYLWTRWGIGYYFGTWAFEGRFYGGAVAPTLTDSERTNLRSWVAGLGGITIAGAPAPAPEPPPPGDDNVNYRYVDPNAASGGDGMSWSTAFNALPSSPTRGLTYWCAKGTLPGKTFNTAVSSTTVITIKKATVAAHGTNTGWSNSMADAPTVFNGGLTFSTGYWEMDGQYGSWLDGSDGTGDYGFEIIETDSQTPILAFIGGTQQVIKHFRAQGRTDIGTGGGSLANDAFRLEGSIGVTLSDFEVTDCGRCGVWGRPRTTVIERGWFKSHHSGGASDIHSELMSLWAVGGAVGNCTIRHNLFSHAESTGGIMFDSVTNKTATCKIYGNVFAKLAGTRTWNSGGNGLIGSWDSNGSGRAFMLVFHNTFHNITTADAATIFGGNGLDFGSNELRNNLFVACNSPSDVSDFSAGVSHNHFIGSPTFGTNQSSHTAGTDPFVNAAARDFRIKAGITIPVGTNQQGTVGTVDGYGATRTNIRGAFEQVAA